MLGLKYLRLHLVPLRVCISRKMVLGTELRFTLRHYTVGCRLPKMHLNCNAKPLFPDFQSGVLAHTCLSYRVTGRFT